MSVRIGKNQPAHHRGNRAADDTRDVPGVGKRRIDPRMADFDRRLEENQLKLAELEGDDEIFIDPAAWR